MHPQNRSLTGASSKQLSTGQDALTFPGRLINPPKSQIVQSEDAVTDRIVKLDSYAQQLGAGFGIPSAPFVLNPLSEPKGEIGTALATIAVLLHKEQRVTLERRGGKWGLFYTREAAVVGQDQRSETVPLKDSPLDVRERFLLKSEEFFRTYLDLCKDRLGKMHGCVEKGDRTLALLANLRFE